MMLGLDAAAGELGIATVTLRRWCRQGCPHQPGRKGRGHAAMVDPDEVRAWQRANVREAIVMEIAAVAPGVLAAATADAFTQIEANDKHRQAGVLAATWYVLTTALLDHLRAECPGVPDLKDRRRFPEQVERLRQIAAM